MWINKRVCRNQFLCLPLYLFLCFGTFFARASSVEEPPFASIEEITEAVNSFDEWAAAYEAKEFNEMWRLTDPRIRKWHEKRRWKRIMRKAHRRSGAILSYEKEAIFPVNATQIPCTEMGHCYRKGVQYVFILINSHYEKASPPQPEYVVMAKSHEGWRFGGGTFPNRPMGETSAILDRKDERQYEYNGVIQH